MKIIAVIASILLVGCSSSPTVMPSVVSKDSKGNVLEEVTHLTEDAYTNGKLADAQVQCFKSRETDDPMLAAVLALGDAATAGHTGMGACAVGHNSNDTKIVKSKETTKRIGIAAGFIRGLLPWFFAGNNSGGDTTYNAGGSINTTRGDGASITEVVPPYSGVEVNPVDLETLLPEPAPEE
jgi:hypothetical protein